jgi:hypothetical protein
MSRVEDASSLKERKERKEKLDIPSDALISMNVSHCPPIPG